MSFSIGNSIKYVVFGESHTQYIGMSIDSIPSGLEIDMDYINSNLKLRRPSSAFETTRVEQDEIIWISGVESGVSNGLPITFLIKNSNVRKKDYSNIANKARPSHADYGAFVKYDGRNSRSGGSIFSGRLTVLYVVAGSIVELAIKKFHKLNLIIDSNVISVGEISVDCKNLEQESLNDYLSYIKSTGDSVGGKIKLECKGIPAGIGNPIFNSFESILSHYMFSIPGVKAIEFGMGSEIATKKGSEVADEMYFDKELFNDLDDVKFYANNNGGIIGGITNSAPIIITLSFKPASSISIELRTIDLSKMHNTSIKTLGRHDVAYVLRTPIIVKSMFNMAIYDMLRGMF